MLRFKSKDKIPRDFGRLHVALSMDERCRVMEEFGGVYYAGSE